MGADMENPDAGNYVAVTPASTEPYLKQDKWFRRYMYFNVFAYAIYLHYMLVKFDTENPGPFAVANMCGFLLYFCSIIVTYKCFSPKRTGADVENADDGDYVAVTTTEPYEELNKWIHGLMFCYSVALIIYVDYKLVKLDPASLRTIFVIELFWLLLSCLVSILIYKSVPPKNSKLLP